MVADPCNAEVVQGLYGEQLGYVTKFKSVHSISSTELTFAFMVNPYSFGVTATAGNIIEGFTWAPTGGGVSIVNSVADPLGTNVATSGGSIRIAGSNFINSTTAGKARVVGCCIRMYYTGTMSSCAGRVAYLEGLNNSQILDLFTADTLFQLASKTSRVTIDPMEVTYRPDEVSDSRMHPTNVGAIVRGTPAASASASTQEGDDLDPKWIGFCVQGIAPSNFTFEVIRILEWQPDIVSGIAQSVPVSSGQSMVRSVLTYLDASMPGWTTTVSNVVRSGISTLASAALAGSVPRPNLMGRNTPMRIMY